MGPKGNDKHSKNADAGCHGFLLDKCKGFLWPARSRRRKRHEKLVRYGHGAGHANDAFADSVSVQNGKQRGEKGYDWQKQ